MESKLTYKRRMFVEAYLKTFNASDAARLAGYKGAPNKVGSSLMTNMDIKAAIEQRLQEVAMKSDEVLARLAEQARGDMGDFLDISSMGYQLDLDKAKELGITRLIKKVKQHTVTTLSKDGVETETHTIEIELYDAQAALALIGKHLKLFSDSLIDLGGGKITVTLKRDD